MRVSIASITFLFVSFLASHETLAFHIENNDEAALEKIDISPTSIILDIFKDVTTECETINGGRVFSLLLEDYESGEKAYIVHEMDRRIDQYENLLGYTIIDNDTIIVYGKLLSDFHFSKDPAPLHFQIKDYMRSDFPEWLYFINDGIFARDGESMGWIWHIPSERLRDYKLTKFAITAPKRTKK